MEKKPSYKSPQQQVKDLKAELAGLRALAGIEKIASILDAMADGITITDLFGKVTYVNKIMVERMGLAREVLLGKPAGDFIHEEDREKVIGCIREIISRKIPFKTVQCRSVNPSGEEIPVSMRFSLLHDAQNHPHAMVAVGRDISEEKKVLDELKESEERLRILFDAAPDGIFLLDFKGVFQDMNRTSEDLIGYGKEEVIGRDFLELNLVSPEEIPRVFQHLARSATGEPGGPEEFTLIRKDGEKFFVEVRTYPVTLDGKKGVLGIARDISLRKLADERLRDTQAQLVQAAKLAAIGELAAGVAHELNQPLTVMRMSAQLALRKSQKGTSDAGDLPELGDVVDKNTRRMMNIINHLRQFSRQSEKVSVPVDMNRVIEECFLMVGEQLRLRNITVEKTLSPDIPQVKGDPNELEQVVLNLIGNARDAVELRIAE